MIKITLLLMLFGIGIGPFIRSLEKSESELSSSERYFLNQNARAHPSSSSDRRARFLYSSERAHPSSVTDADPPPPYSSLFPETTSATTMEPPPPPYPTDAEIAGATTVGVHPPSETGTDSLLPYFSLNSEHSAGPAGLESISVPIDLVPAVSGSTPVPTRLVPAVSGSTPVPTRLVPAVSGSTPELTGLGLEASGSTSVPTRLVSAVSGDSVGKRMRNFFVKHWKYINYALLVFFFGLLTDVVRNVIHNKHFTSSLASEVKTITKQHTDTNT